MHKMYRSPHFMMITFSLKPGQNWRRLLFSGSKQSLKGRNSKKSARIVSERDKLNKGLLKKAAFTSFSLGKTLCCTL